MSCPEAATDTRSVLAAQPSAAWSRAFRTGVLSALGVLVLLRFGSLELRPLHYDESVNLTFLSRLHDEGVYQYQAGAFHGPTLYYAALLPVRLLGLEIWVVRAVPALFSVLLVVLVARWCAVLGPQGALAAALLLAASPGIGYYSRDFIHELLFVTFTLGLVFAAWRFWVQRSAAWLSAAAIWGALLFATKETAVPTFVVLLLASGCAWLYARWRGLPPEPRVPARAADRSLLVAALAAALVFVTVAAILYSSFFTFPAGVGRSLGAFAFWVQNGLATHVHPFWTHLSWLWQGERALLLLGGLGLTLALTLAESRALLFLAFWSLGVFSMYSLSPYKTPWLALNIVLPLALLGGYAFDVIWRRAGHVLGSATLGIACIAALTEATRLNLQRYDDVTHAYVYAHTFRSIRALLARIDALAERAGGRAATPVAVLAPEARPLDWYLRHYSHVNYLDWDRAPKAAIVVGALRQEAEMQARLGPGFTRDGEFPLRNHVTLVLYVKTDLLSAAPAHAVPSGAANLTLDGGRN